MRSWSFKPKPRDGNQRIPPLGVSLGETLSSKRAESTIPCSLTCLVASKALSGISDNGAKSIYLSRMVFLLYQTVAEREREIRVRRSIRFQSQPRDRKFALLQEVKKQTSELMVEVFRQSVSAISRTREFRSRSCCVNRYTPNELMSCK